MQFQTRHGSTRLSTWLHFVANFSTTAFTFERNRLNTVSKILEIVSRDRVLASLKRKHARMKLGGNENEIRTKYGESWNGCLISVDIS